MVTRGDDGGRHQGDGCEGEVHVKLCELRLTSDLLNELKPSVKGDRQQVIMAAANVANHIIMWLQINSNKLIRSINYQFPSYFILIHLYIIWCVTCLCRWLLLWSL